MLNPGDDIAFLGPLNGGTEGLFHSLGERFGIKAVDATHSFVSPEARAAGADDLIADLAHALLQAV